MFATAESLHCCKVIISAADAVHAAVTDNNATINILSISFKVRPYCRNGGSLLQNSCLFQEKKVILGVKNYQKVEMENNTHTVDLIRLRTLFPMSSCLNMGNDVSLINVRYDESLSFMQYPCRFDGFMAFFCISGRIRVMINLAEFDVVENSFFVYLPGNIISIPEVAEAEKANLNFMVIAMTNEYVESLNIKPYKIIDKRIQLQSKPFFLIRSGEKAVARQYVMLAKDILESNLAYKRESISSLLASFFFLAGGIMEQRAGEEPATDLMPDKAVSRAGHGEVVFEKFIALVAEFHTRERSVGFYADKLCLTPKYLSKLVKAATGKAAPEWIDDYVILEAKNMLKYSDIPVKEIVARLNFPNAPAFHKFFKARTGLTPGQYRKS